MKLVVPSFIASALVLGSLASAQTTPELKVPSEPLELPAGVKVLRAIPVEEPPVINVEALSRIMPAEAKQSYSQCHVEGNVIALTFDDGPHPQNTPRLLDMLKERGIKATFFLIGKSASTWPKIVQRIVDEGHEIGNHTWSHPQLNHMKTTSVMDQLQKTHDAIVKACGVAPIVYRPPYGAILLSQRKAIHEKFQYVSALWDVDPLDWKSPRSSTKVHDRVLAQTKPGSIILCHDIHAETVDAMPAVMDELKARGFQFVTVTQLINLDAQTAAKKAEPVAAIPVTIELAQPAAAAPAPVAPPAVQAPTTVPAR